MITNALLLHWAALPTAWTSVWVILATVIRCA